MTNREYLEYCMITGVFPDNMQTYIKELNLNLIDSDVNLRYYFEIFKNIRGNQYTRINNLNWIYKACLGNSENINKFLVNLKEQTKVYESYVKSDRAELMRSYEDGLQVMLQFFARNTFKGYHDVVGKMSLGIKLRFCSNTINYKKTCDAKHSKNGHGFDICDKNGNVLVRDVVMIMYKDGNIESYTLERLNDTNKIYSILKKNIKNCDYAVLFVSMLERRLYRFIEYLYGSCDKF